MTDGLGNPRKVVADATDPALARYIDALKAYGDGVQQDIDAGVTALPTVQDEIVNMVKAAMQFSVAVRDACLFLGDRLAALEARVADL